MPDLLHMLIDYDPAMVKIIAGKWGVGLENPSQLDAAKELTSLMLAPGEVKRILNSLPDAACDCLSGIRVSGGKLAWQDFMRRNGPIREMGIARRDREAPHTTPLGAAEILWYYGLIGRAFLDVGGEVKEFVYIPEEFMNLVLGLSDNAADPKVATIDHKLLHIIHTVDDRILDHLTSYLAAVRSGQDPHELVDEFKLPSITECEHLLTCCGLLDGDGNPVPEAVKSFLAKPRGEALSLLFSKWLSSPTFNELTLMPGIILEGIWRNDPLKARHMIMEKIRALDGSSWCGIDSFISSIKLTQPDFQRPGGDYDSWMVRSRKNGDNLSGFEHWDQVDGALIRYILQGPLHWLGYLDLGVSSKGIPPEAFRLSVFAESLDHERPAERLPDESGHVTALRNGTLTCPRDVPRSVRYLLARFCERAGANDKGYHYRITGRSLKHAASQGLQTEQLLALLSRHSGGVFPTSLVTALQRAARNGSQVSLKRVAILRVSNAEIMLEIRNSPIGRFLGEPLSPTIVVLPPTAIERLIPRLMELGYICDLDEDTLQVQPDKG
jgi:hypothetical protein